MGVLTLRGVIPPGRRVAARRAAAMAVAPPLGPPSHQVGGSAAADRITPGG